jgi:type IV secretory pathway VirJ component
MPSLLKNKFFILILIICLGVITLAYVLLRSPKINAAENITISTFNLNNNEKIKIVQTAKPEKGLLTLVTNNSNPALNEGYAKKFAALSYYVAVVDGKSILNSPISEAPHCLNLAEKLTSINAQLQTHLKLNSGNLPILVGIEDGASVVYAALAQAEKQKFHAAVGINFSSQLETHLALCSQENFTNLSQGNPQNLAAVNRLPTSFYVFQDETSQNVASKEFTDKVGNLKLTLEENTEHAVSEAIQILQWLDPRLTDQISSDASDSDLPIIEVPEKAIAEKSVDQYTSDTLAILITGDGGWAAIDKNIARIMAKKGIPTVALDALSYFWKARTPEQTTNDVESIIIQYLTKWNKKHVVLIGYSFGADVLPFITNNLTEETKKQIALVALLGMGKTAAFEFRLSSWMNADKASSRLPLLPEIKKMKWANSICVYGADDPSANCLPVVGLGVKAIRMNGDHHFDEKYEELVQHIIENIKIRP